MNLWSALLVVIALVVALILFAIGEFRKRSVDRWLISYLLQARRRFSCTRGPIHVLICIADHFEPGAASVNEEVVRSRIDRWVRDYPNKFGAFRDSDGRAPRHTFFYPIEEYDADSVDALAMLCRAGYGEIEIHLHHDNDNAENLRATLLKAQELFSRRHGLLSRDHRTGNLAYGFVHGNWALR